MDCARPAPTRATPVLQAAREARDAVPELVSYHVPTHAKLEKRCGVVTRRGGNQQDDGWLGGEPLKGTDQRLEIEDEPLPVPARLWGVVGAKQDEAHLGRGGASGGASGGRGGRSLVRQWGREWVGWVAVGLEGSSEQ